MRSIEQIKKELEEYFGLESEFDKILGDQDSQKRLTFKSPTGIELFSVWFTNYTVFDDWTFQDVKMSGMYHDLSNRYFVHNILEPGDRVELWDKTIKEIASIHKKEPDVWGKDKVIFTDGTSREDYGYDHDQKVLNYLVDRICYKKGA